MTVPFPDLLKVCHTCSKVAGAKDEHILLPAKVINNFTCRFLFHQLSVVLAPWVGQFSTSPTSTQPLTTLGFLPASIALLISKT